MGENTTNCFPNYKGARQLVNKVLIRLVWNTHFHTQLIFLIIAASLELATILWSIS